VYRSAAGASSIAEQAKVCELAFDNPSSITIPASLFCLTGEFLFAPRSRCESMLAERGATAQRSVTKKLNYLVVGGLGSDEWKHGSFGTKITKAMEYQRKGCPIMIVHEDVWASAL
jgi:NAD-dependent DNA ligase